MSELLRHLNSNIDINRPLDSTIGPILWRHFSDTIIIIEFEAILALLISTACYRILNTGRN